MSIIFITEKPSVAQEYRKVLKINSSGKTDGYIEGNSSVMKDNVIITWAVGHLVAICPPEEQNPEWSGRWSVDKLPMIPKVFKYEPQKSTLKQFKVVQSLYTRKDVTAIYYAGDSGREGIYIQALIRNQIFKPTFKATPKIDERVVWIDSQTEAAILDGIQNAKPYSHYQNMIDSGYARARADWLIGMNFTEGFTLTSGKLINTGRVMTPTLAMIVNRQREIDTFVKTNFYGVKTNGNIFWKAVQGSRFFESNLLYNENGFLKLEDANKLIDELNTDKTLAVEDVKVQKKTEYAPYLFNLADLQAFCSKRYKISPSKTLEIAQSLYEKKFTTYPRTDCRFLSSAVAKDLKAMGYNVPKRYVDDSKVTDHYAIIPTFHGNASSLSGIEADVYGDILKRFNDTMLPPYVYDAVSITYLHKIGERFFESFRKIKDYGFKEKGGKDDEDVSDKPVPKKNSLVKVDAFSLREMETKPPVAYTTGSIILAMEKAGKLIDDEELREQIKTCGIGTSATRAAIIEKLKEKEFITVDKKQVIAPTEFGKAVIPIVAEYDEALISPIKTADMEANLNAIVTGELTIDRYMETVNNYVATTTKRIISSNKNNLSAFDKDSSSAPVKKHNCPCCNAELKYGRYGWYCDCKYSFNLEVCGHKMKEKDLEDILSKGETKVYSFKSKKGTTFKAKLVLNKNTRKNDFEFDNSATPSQSTKGGWGSKNNSNSNNSNPSSKTTGGWGSKSSTSSASQTTTSSTSGGWGQKTSSSSSGGWGQKTSSSSGGWGRKK